MLCVSFLLSGFFISGLRTREQALVLFLCVDRGSCLAAVNWSFYSAQFVPQISADSSVEVINFCRTPQWYTQRVSPKFDTTKAVVRAIEQVPFFGAFRPSTIIPGGLNGLLLTYHS